MPVSSAPKLRTSLLVIVFALFALFAPFSSIVSADSTSTATVSYQGQLADAEGIPLDGAVDIAVRLYDDEGRLLWTESHDQTDVVAGTFHLLLGSSEPLARELFGERARWLEIEVNGEVLEPRQALAPVPYALRASCEPGTIVGCYSGPEETLHVGTCRPGSRFCGSDGRYGECRGEVLPAEDDCVQMLDGSCDGALECRVDPVCGDGSVDAEAAETCDDGNLSNADACLANCQPATCGDGFLYEGHETCEVGIDCSDRCDSSDCQARSCSGCQCVNVPDGLTCKGESYDADGDITNGCEVADSPRLGHRRSSARDAGAFSCKDGQRFSFSGRLPSDARPHAPAVPDFDADSGSAPDWYRLFAAGGAGCANDLGATLSVSGSSYPGCYRLKVVTDVGTHMCDTGLSGSCSLTAGEGAYRTDSYLFIEVSKTCDTSVTESPSYSVKGHL